MKGFIEVTDCNSEKRTLNLNCIFEIKADSKDAKTNCMISFVNQDRSFFRIMETYEEVLELIENAQQ